MSKTENKELFKKWLHSKLNEWEKEQGERQSLGAFANYLSVPQPTLGHWLHGRRVPGFESVALIAQKLGPEAFIVTGYMDPLHPAIQYLQGNIEYLDDEEIEEVVGLITKMLRAKGVTINMTSLQSDSI